MIALQLSSDPVRPKVIVLSQVEDLADDRGRRGSRRVVRHSGPIGQAGFPMLLKALFPTVGSGARDAEVPTGLCYMAMLTRGVLQDSQPPGDEPCLFCFCNGALLLPKP